MALAVTIFGISSDKLAPTLCHILLRVVRGPGAYPAPTLPKDTPRDLAISALAIEGTPLSLLSWDVVIPDADQAAVIAELESGQFTIPPACPIADGAVLPGVPFGPIVVPEKRQPVPVSGSGLLYRKGLAMDGPFQALRDSLSAVLPSGMMPFALKGILEKTTAFSGIDEILKDRRALGAVDFYYRAFEPALIEGPLFDVAPDKSDMKKPMLKVHIRRHAAPANEFFRIAVELKNHDDILCSYTLDVAGGTSAAVADAPAHITDVSLSVFDASGALVDLLDGAFLQSMNFGLSVFSGSDALPPAFAGSSKSSDLENRPRVTTTTFDRPTAKGLSGGLGILRQTDKLLEDQIGKVDATPENVWFERGAEGQLEVIHWIKRKVETPGVAKAFLVDPYLGSEALKRVIARQGNESIDLKILISPGNVDPDAEEVAATPGGKFLEALVQTATDWADKLAGRIEIVHIKRGSGTRQAFHDRYLCTVDRDGIPTVYLLSNSLSKAAGDWPFTVAELDRVTAWRVYSDILSMLDGTAPGAEPETLWQKNGGSSSHVPPAVSAPPAEDQPAWIPPAQELLTKVYAVITRNSEFKETVGLFSTRSLRTRRPALTISASGAVSIMLSNIATRSSCSRLSIFASVDAQMLRMFWKTGLWRRLSNWSRYLARNQIGISTLRSALRFFGLLAAPSRER